jgi:type I restriction enzyme S subunit
MSRFFAEFVAPSVTDRTHVLPARAFLQERKDVSDSGSEDLLSVSEYTGVTRRADGVEEGDFLSRAESLEGYRHVSTDDLVINYMLAWKGALGVSPLSGIASPAYAVFTIDRTKAHPRFVHALLRSGLFRAYFKTESTGIIESRLRLYPESLLTLRMGLPPLDEQERIAKFLDHETARIDALIEKKARFIELLREKRNVLIVHAVTKGLNPNVSMRQSGVDWIGMTPEHWAVSRLGYFATVENGTTPSRDDESFWHEGTVPWLGSGEVNQQYISEATELISELALSACSLRLLPKETVVVGMVGQGKTRGLAAILKIDAAINQNLAAVCCGPRLFPMFLLYVFGAAYDWIRESGRGSNQAALNCEILSAVRIALPPLAEQQAIVDHVSSMVERIERLVARTEDSVALLKERRAALITAAVTGQIDLRADQPALEPT